MRKLAVLIFVASLVLVLPVIAIAGTWGPKVYWSSACASYAPYRGYGQLYEYTDSTGKLKLSPKAKEIYFTQSAVDQIKYYYNNGYNGKKPLYYTFDIAVDNDYDTTLNAFYYYVTNFPGYHFDTDDDPEPYGNGYNDETEVVSLKCYEIKASQPYYFESYFEVKKKPPTSSPTRIAYSSQESYEHWSGEYDTMFYCTHIRLNYPW